MTEDDEASGDGSETGSQCSSAVSPRTAVGASAIAEAGAAAVVTVALPRGKRVPWRQRRRIRHKCRSAAPLSPGLTEETWRELRGEGGRVTNVPALLRAVRDGGVAPRLRPDVWPLLLGLVRYDDGASARRAKWATACDDYGRLAKLAENDEAAAARYSSQGAQEPWLVTKRRVMTDSVRTASDGPLFRGAQRNGAVARLERLLLAYALHDPETGYCQGMADLAAPFVHLYETDAEAFAVYRCMMRPLAPNFHEGLAAISGQMRELRAVLAALEAPLLCHLDRLGASNFETAFQMLLLLFRRELSWPDTFTFWETLWAGEAMARAPLRVHAVAALFSSRRRELLQLESLEDLVMWVNGIGSDRSSPLDPLALAADAHQMYEFISDHRAAKGCSCIQLPSSRKRRAAMAAAAALTAGGGGTCGLTYGKGSATAIPFGVQY